jgi:hypothetical protein
MMIKAEDRATENAIFFRGVFDSDRDMSLHRNPVKHTSILHVHPFQPLQCVSEEVLGIMQRAESPLHSEVIGEVPKAR